MRKIIFLLFIGTLFFSAAFAQTTPHVLGYSAGENVKADGFNVSFSGGTPFISNGQWTGVDMGKTLIGFNFNVVIVPQTFTEDLQVSKGYFDNFVDIKWRMKNNENVVTRFKIFRKKVGSAGDSIEVANLSADERHWRDEYCETGMLYEYTLYAEGIFGKPQKWSNYIQGIGFRIPYGVIAGRTTFTTGNAVEGVEVMAEADEDFSGSSLYLNGTDAYLAVSPDAGDTQFDFDPEFTFQAWIKPESTGTSTIFEKGSQYKITHEEGLLNFTADGQTIQLAFDQKPDTFVNVTAVRTADSLKLYAFYDSKTIHKASAELTSNPVANNADIYIGKSGSSEYFMGYIDEVRIWHKALTDKEVEQRTGMYISGTEDGITGYYRFNEAVGEGFYDLAREGFDFHENHGFMYKAEWAKVVPFSKQLAVKGISDENGNYSIPGIPYSSTGTNYRFIPVFDVHEFDPNEKLLFMGPGSSSHNNVDFTDIAAFAVKGNVKYKDTYFPVKGASLFIDGKQIVKASGEPVYTDDFGNYEISVPIGYHYIEVKMLGHEFEDEGRYPLEGNWNFQEPVSNLNFIDKTLVKVVGRVAGGPREAAKPIGLGKTTNNIGNATIKLTTQREYDLTDNPSGINSVWMQNVYSDGVEKEKGQTAYNIQALSPKNITINANTETGEYVAYLLPEKYMVTGITAGNYTFPDVFHTTLDLSKHHLVQTEKDSVITGIDISPTGDTIYHYSTDSIMYDYNFDFIYREKPELSVTNADGEPAFWERTVEANDGTEVAITDENGMPLTEWPVFEQRKNYEMKISVFEKYTNADNGNIEDKVPVTDGKVEIQNALAINDSRQTFDVNKFGEVSYSFDGGLPNITGDFTNSMSITAYTGQNGSIITPWEYNGGVFKGYLLGGMPTGNNFVTTGPTEIDMVIRDPYGSNSYAYYEEGQTTTKTFSYNFSAGIEDNISASVLLGTKTITWAGVGGGAIMENDVENDITVGLELSTTFGSNNSIVTTTTNTKRWATSTDPEFVGALGDVFIGHSTNIIYGNAVFVSVIPEADCDECVDDVNGYKIGTFNSIRVNPEFGTAFQYSQNHIVNYLLPNLEELRNHVLSNSQYYTSVYSEDNDNYGSNNTNKPEPVTISNPGDTTITTYGNSYTIQLKVPQNWPSTDSLFVDSVAFYNKQIEAWEKILKDNEKAKIEARKSPPKENLSFDAGVVYESSITNEKTSEHVGTFEFMIAPSLSVNFGTKVMGMGMKFSMSKRLSFTNSEEYGVEKTKSTTFGFELADPEEGDYFSMDVYESDDFTGPIFYLKGGQSQCPHEGGEVSEYYQAGKSISEETMRVEVPQIACEAPVQVNVPEDDKAIFNIELRNASETGDEAWLMLSVDEASNQNGASISIDGKSLGNGKLIYIDGGATIRKVITIEKTRPDINDYEDIGIIFHSACQFDPGNNWEDISDTIHLTARFQPVCTSVDVLNPENQWVLNTNGDTTLTVKMQGYDLQHSSFNKVALQYKSTSTSNWATEMIFYVDEDEYNAANEPKELIDGRAGLEYKFDWTSMQDRNYDIKATSYCADGTINNSEILTGIKDVKRPMVFGSPQPADGILTSGEDIMITFDEPINAGLLLPYNFTVQGVLNGNKIKHQSCVYFDGQEDYATAIKGVNVENKSWTIEFWLRRGELTEGVILSQGGIEIGFNAVNKFYLNAGGQILTSEQTIADTEIWKHYAVTYDAETDVFNMYINDSKEREKVPRTANSAGNGKLYVGKSPATGNHFNGYIHELRIWEKALGFGVLYAQMYRTLAGNEVGLGGYWPMDEARGDLATDKSRNRHLLFFGAAWRVFPNGYARIFDGTANIDIETGASVVIPKDADFTIEFYFIAGEQTNTVMFSNGTGEGTDITPPYQDIWVIGFNEVGELYAKNNGTYIIVKGEDFLDDKWYHLALVKDEIANTTLYIDGKQKAFEQSLALGGLYGADMTIGARREWHSDAATYDHYFTGQIDEFRIWNLARSKKQLELDMNSKLRGEEMGLVAYYPFDEYNDLGIELIPSMLDITGEAGTNLAIATNGDVNNTDVPNIKDARPVQEVAFDWVVNNDRVVININEPPALIEKCVLEFTIDRVEDLRENRIASPATWTAYIKQNPVVWTEESLVIKKEAYKDYEFDVQIQNVGGTEQSFRLTGIPSWLMVDMEEGTIPPDSYLTLHFTIDPVVNIGYYDFSLFLESDFGYPEKLNIDLNVYKPTPNWVVSPDNFQYSMSVIGQLLINSAVSDDENDLVAAFVNGECRGVTNVSYVRAYDNFGVYLTIYSNVPSGEKVEFRIWDASTGQIITDIQPVLSFANNGLIGTPAEPIDITANAFYEAHIPLSAGWNWVSFNLQSDALNSSDELFKTVTLKEQDMIKSATAMDIYSEVSNSWFGTLSAIEGITQGKNYMIKTSLASTLVYAGNQVNPSTQLTMVPGWNWIGFIPLQNMPLKEAFSGFEPAQNDVVKSQTTFAYYDEALGWIGSLTFMRANEGYLYKSANDVTFSYPERTKVFKNTTENLITDVKGWNINRKAYENNMSVIAKVVGLKSEADLVLGAFAGNECRGIIEPINVSGEKQFFLTVYGDDNENISFKVIDRNSGNVYAASETELYSENAVVGTPSTPFILNFSQTAIAENNSTLQLFNMYPNPFSNKVNFDFSKLNGVEQIEITNAEGKKIVVLDAKGKNLFVWDGSELAAGVYFVKIQTATGVKYAKLVKTE